MVRFAILGPVELQTADRRYVPRGPKVRKVLALMLTRLNQVVDIDDVAEELWDETPPRAAVTTVRTHVYHLRKMLEHEAGVPSPEGLLVTQPAGYLLRADPTHLDAVVFARLTQEGRRLLDDGRAQEAAPLLGQALGMWRGAPLANVLPGRVLSRHVAHLEEMRGRALELRIEADMRLGKHRELVAELRGLVTADPLNEWLHAQLIEALRRSGRRGEALGAFRDLRKLLDEELGLEPSVELQRLHYDILAGGDRRAPSPLTGLAMKVHAV